MSCTRLTAQDQVAPRRLGAVSRRRSAPSFSPPPGLPIAPEVARRSPIGPTSRRSRPSGWSRLTAVRSIRTWFCRATSAPITAARCSPAPAVTSPLGAKTSARMCRKARCWRRSRRPISTSSSRRRRRSSSQLQASGRSGASQRRSRQGDRTAHHPARRAGLDEQGARRHRPSTAVSRAAAVEVAKANVVAQQAVVDRLQELVGFEQIRAPFDGVVTARNVDIGDLVNAGGTTGRALFQVADIHRVRVYVNVPQGFLGELAPGVQCDAALARPEGDFRGRDGVDVEFARREFAHRADRAASGQSGRQALARRLRRGPFPYPRRRQRAVACRSRRWSSVARACRSPRSTTRHSVALKPVRLGRNLGNQRRDRSRGCRSPTA